MSNESQSLEEKLKRAQELAAQKAREKIQADEEAARVAVQSQITQLQEKRQNLKTLLEQMTHGYTEVAEPLGEFKQKKEKVSELYGLYTQLLQNEFGKEVAQEEFGINPGTISSKQDFVKALAAGEEVKQYHESGKVVREKIKEAREAKKQLRREIQQEDEEPANKRKKVIQAVENRIATLDTEIEMLREKTPEGKEEKEKTVRQTVKDKVIAHHQGMHYAYTDFYKEVDRGTIRQWHFVAPEDVGFAKEHGEALIQQIIKEYYYKKIDEGADHKRKENGLDKVREDFNYIEKYLESSYDGIRRVEKLVGWRKQVEEELLRALHKDQWERYGRSQVLEEVTSRMTLSKDFRDDPLQSLHSESIDMEKQAKEVKNFWLGASRYLFREISRPERVIAYANRLEGALEHILEAARNNPELLTQKEFLESYRDVGGDITEEEKTKRYVFHDATINWIQEIGFNINLQNRPEQMLARQEREIEAEAQRKKDLISAGIDVEWADKKKEIFRREHTMDSILEEYKKIEQQRRQVDEIMRSLSSLQSVFLAKPEETITIKKDNLGTQYLELELSRKGFEEIDKELVSKRRELGALREQMTSKNQESEGILRWKAKRIEREYRELDTKKKSLEEEIKNLESRREKLFTAYLELKEKVDSVVHALDLVEYILEKQVTLKDILDLIPSRVHEIRQKQLSPEKRELYNEYNRLTQEFEEAEKKYKKSITSSR